MVLCVDVDLSSTSSDCPCDEVNSETEECQEKNCIETVETVWKRVIEMCCSDSLKRFLSKRGKLTSLIIDKGNFLFLFLKKFQSFKFGFLTSVYFYFFSVSGVASAELEFYTRKHVTRAEKSWKMIADSFQSVLGCNVEIRMNLVTSAFSPPKSSAKAAAASLFFGLFFSCSRRMLHKSYLTTTNDYASEEHLVTNNSLRSCQGNLLRAPSVRSSANASSSRMSSASDQGDATSVLCTTSHMPSPGGKMQKDRYTDLFK